ncbi:uncharacterized protein LOC114531374 [Dendronephthya gigantea]|uniref:uncharacterized protein LOC114531374 n=1 Tax=Dendronephthya gigantea TaxID=151771 RepID=UPI0010699ECB|nr:uncharacterized protein LOC114531374 [Dendronephthya gigantea]
MNPNEGYREARRLLKTKYGRSYLIATAYVERLTSYPPIKSEDGESLQRFSIMLTTCKNALKQVGYLSKIENPDSMQKIVEKLPFGLRQKWRDVADDITEVKQREITIEDITSFVEKRARACNHPIFGKISREVKLENAGRKNVKPTRGSSFATKGKDGGSVRTKVVCPSCESNHWLSQCDDFKKRSIEERFKLVRSLKLCDNCLVPGHVGRSCEKKSFCKIEGCKHKHSTFLHRKPTDPGEDERIQRQKNEGAESQPPSQAGEQNAHNGYVNADDVRRNSPVVGLPILPVKVRAVGGTSTVETYAFLDGGSNTSFITKSLLNKLAAKSRKTTLLLTTMEKERSKLQSSVVSLEVSDLNGQNTVEIMNVFSVSKLPVLRDDIPRQGDVDRWSHLEGIVLKDIDSEVGLLIGNDVPKALQPKEVVESNSDGPYAIRTVWGWTVNGPLGRSDHHSATANCIQSEVQNNELENIFRQYCNREFNDVDDDVAMSCHDRRALSIMEETVRLKDSHYEIALPWKSPRLSSPKNKSVAVRRLMFLKKRLARDNDLFQKYVAFIQDLLQKGYARKLTKEENTLQRNITWYLSHHPVFHPQKPDKVRVVFDCAAEYGSTSLNKQLLQGPDLTNSLVGFLTRFREGPIAMMADIEAMFHQVRVRPEDCDALRFLWWSDNDLSREPEDYQMTVHLFGGVSSPTCANFALRQTADDNAKE